MKRSALILVLSLSVTATFASYSTIPETLDCRETVLNLDLAMPTVQLVKYDLTHGLWTSTDNFGNKQTYQFNEDGMVVILDEDVNGNSFFRSALWRVELFDGSPYLVLTQRNMLNDKLLHIELNCEGVALNDLLNQEELVLNYHPLEKDIRVNLTKANLIGDWTNVTYLEKAIPEAFQSIIFNPDGTFSLTKMNGMTSKGAWEVAKDGRHIVLYLAFEKQLHDPEETLVLKIGKVDDHGLVLGQTVAVGESNFELAHFTFIK